MRLLGIKALAVTYFHMGRPHTIMGAKWFHYRVRNGIGWYPLAIAARKSGATRVRNKLEAVNQNAWGYMVKPHG